MRCTMTDRDQSDRSHEEAENRAARGGATPPAPAAGGIDTPLAAQPDTVAIRPWRYQPDAWRWVKRFNHRYANSVLRLRSARVMPGAIRARFSQMGLPPEIIEETLASIRKLDQWSDAWTRTAQVFMGEYRRQISAKNDDQAAKSQWLAAMSYHAAQIVTVAGQERTAVTCRAAAASLFRHAQPWIYPKIRRLEVSWRAGVLPAFMQIPDNLTRPCGLVVLLNGASTSKEETLLWSSAFLQAGLAVMALDSPGTGETSGRMRYSADQDDILDGIFDLARDDPLIDATQVFAAGISMGGNQAVRCAAYDRRIAGVIAVTPPYDPPRWLPHASPLLTQELLAMSGDETDEDANDLNEIAATFSLFTAASAVRCPVLVFGAGRDIIVPPTEAQLLANRLGNRGTLVWYPNAGHCLYDQIREWTSDAALWINAVREARTASGPYEDATAVATQARIALNGAQTFTDEDVFGGVEEGTRLLDPSEFADDLPLDDDPDLYRAPDSPRASQ
jgi:alpha-beta hydrolase superfamily lysophospholipase